MDDDQAARLTNAEDALARLVGLIEEIDARLEVIEGQLSEGGVSGRAQSGRDGRRVC